MIERDGARRPAAPDVLGLAGRAASHQLRGVLLEIARDQADEGVESADRGVWAGLMRDPNSVVDQIPGAALDGGVELQPGRSTRENSPRFGHRPD